MTSDPGPLARLEDVKGDAGAPGEVFRLLTAEESKTLAQIAKEWRVPKGRFVEWFTTKHPELYDAALKVKAADCADAAAQAALDATPETVQGQKLKGDTALRLASRWDRARYGESVKVERDVTLKVDVGLLGTAGALLERFRREKVVAPFYGQVELTAEPPLALPSTQPERRGTAKLAPITIADLI